MAGYLFMEQVSVNQPWISRCSYVFQGTKLWIIMEYLGGGSALDLMKAGSFDEQNISIILREILKGLDYLHSEGKIHRDIKGKHHLHDLLCTCT